jgi:protein SCO1/2
MQRKIVWSLAVFFILALAGLVAYRQVQANHTFNGTVLTPPVPAHDFVLTSDHGDISLSNFHGKIVLLYFGYTYCPDVCPLTLGKLAQTVQGLGSFAQNVQVIFISVDPERDTPQRLSQYVRAFNPGFLGVTGIPQTIASVTHNYGIFYQKTNIQSPTNYLITHTSVVVVIDQQGRWRLLWPEILEPPAMIHDLKILERQ